jgi:hypothetical protein
VPVQLVVAMAALARPVAGTRAIFSRDYAWACSRGVLPVEILKHAEA